MKRVILVHGWDAGPEGDWFPWLTAELKQRGYQVVAPQLPDAEEPRKEKWVPALASAVGVINTDTYFIAHSMGNQATLRYLETLSDGAQIGGAVFVAGFVKPLINLEGPAEEEIATSWTSAPLDLAKVRSHIPRSIAIFSDNDEWVTLDNVDIFREQLGSEVIREHAQGHFTDDKAPQVLAAFLKLVS